MNPIGRPPTLVRWTLRLEQATRLDRPVQAVTPTIRSVFGTGTSATVLDLVGGRDSSTAARRLIGTGLLVVGPTAWTGWVSCTR